MTTRSGKRSISKNKSRSNTIPGMDQLQEWVDLARYEIEVDPYRGLQELLNGESKVQSPWRRSCAFTSVDASPSSSENKQVEDETKRLETNAKEDILDIESSDDDDDLLKSPSTHEEEALVVSATRGCKCPSLLHWTREAVKKRQRKRKKTDETPLCVAGRPNESLEYRCACDYNPFCFWSLGGVLDDLLLTGTSCDDVELVADWENPNAEGYTSATQEIYKRVRRCTLVNVGNVRDYLDEMVDDVDGAIDRLEAQQSSLYFVNPLVNPDLRGDQRPAKIRMALPPGIENLGATCYLNTQLQCLAQNRVFLHGILRWKCTGNDRMSTVLRLFQNLLAQMHFGPYNTVNTLDFSNALGLDHHEQQDPNEFSRLFLERIHQSFQGSDLHELLPLLFRGENTFETVCQKCRTKSIRKEHFMDLNLPIVEQKSGGARGSVLEFVKPKQKNVDLRDCLKEYSQDEYLDGDNQYYCAHCQSKQDAIRHQKLTSLPSVLNLQLVRYVYNRRTNMKKKVTTAVAIPHFTKLGNQRYRLCAIMSHQGASAYSGHYTAEAMDWASGQWYSFNDETVRSLPEGPKSSYCGTDSERCEGSTDSYNLYFVAENFLTQSIVDDVQRPIYNVPLAYQISTGRKDLYEQLSIMCIADGEAVGRLRKRRQLIKEELSSSRVQSLFRSLSHQDMVWVDTTFLIRYFSCSDGLQSVLENSHYKEVSSLLCEHNKLHPRVARKGKIIPRSVLQLISKCIHEEEGIRGHDSRNVIRPFSISAGDVVCTECANAYTKNLASKLSRVERILKLRDALEHNKLSSAFPLDSPNEQGAENEYAFVISKRFATWFRNAVVDFAKKSLRDAESSERLACATSLLNIKAENAAEGVDGLDPSRYIDPPNGMEEITRKVNGTITCKHEKFSATKKNSYAVVSGILWNKIKALFPQGVEIKFRNNPDTSSDEIPTLENPFCLSCFEEGGQPEVVGDSIDDLRPDSARPIPVDIDDGEVVIVDPPSTTFDIRIFEAKTDSSHKDILDSLAMVNGTDQQPASLVETFLRRSSRKRKIRFPLGCFCDEETCRIDYSNNIASLRLSLVEKCSAGSNFELDHIICLVIAKRKKGETSIIFDNDAIVQQLEYTMNAESLKAVCEKATSATFSDSFDPASSLTLVRIAEREPTILPEISKEEIYDHFISLAHGTSGQTKGRNKSSRAERGFNGTFLLSSEFGSSDHELRDVTEAPGILADDCLRREQSVLDSTTQTRASERLQNVNDCSSSTSGVQQFRTNSDIKPVRDEAEAMRLELSGGCAQLNKENDDKAYSVLESVNQSPQTAIQVVSTQDSKATGLDQRYSPGAKSDSSKTSQVIYSSEKDQADDSRTNIHGAKAIEDDDISNRPTGLLESIVAALTTNPDICRKELNPEMIRLAADQALQSKNSDLKKLIESAYEIYLEFTTV